MPDKDLFVVFTGAPGCGKGTQARILCEKAGICHLSTGEMLRAEIKRETPLGKELKMALDDGGFASDELIIRMVEERIGKEDCRHGFLLDGFPRTLNQAEILEGMLAEKRQKLDAVIEIQVPDEIIMERILGRYACMKCGRGYHDKFLKRNFPAGMMTTGRRCITGWSISVLLPIRPFLFLKRKGCSVVWTEQERLRPWPERLKECSG